MILQGVNSHALSFAQRRLWFLDQLDQNSHAFHMLRTIQLHGPLNVDALRAAMHAILERHEILRSVVAYDNDQPGMMVNPAADIDIPLTDLSDLDALAQQARYDQLITEQLNQQIQLDVGPLMRASIVRRSSDHHALVLLIHHLVFDGWSRRLFHSELAELYDTIVNDTPAPPRPMQYREYVATQPDETSFEPQLDYWKDILRDLPPPIELPDDAKRTDEKTSAVVKRHSLSPELTNRLRRFNRDHRVTPFMTMAAAFQLQLFRLTGQNDIVVGAPVAGRTAVGTEKMIGLFLNMLSLRSKLSNDRSFTDLLKDVRRSALGAYENQNVPFERVVEAVRPQRDRRHHPIFDVVINFIGQQDEPVTSGGVDFVLDPAANDQVRFALELYVMHAGDHFDLRVEYCPNRFSEARIEHLLEQYESLLEQIVESSDKTLGQYSMVSPGAKRTLPDPTAPIEAPPFTAVHDMIAAQTPDRTAIIEGNKTFTYGQLWQRATDIAVTLSQRGVKPGGRVAITGPRSFDLIAAMIAVSRVGGVFVLIDPDLPAERRDAMLQASGAKLTLDITVPDFVSTPGNEPTFPGIDADDPAYIFFTSGTTGQPKGILGRHRGLSHFVAWQRDNFDINHNDRFAQITSLSFDVILRDIFTPLVSGAVVCIPNADTLTDAARVHAWLAQQRITALHAVPTLASNWLSDPGFTETLSDIRLVFSAGEALTDTLVEKWRTHLPDSANVVNLYGPTETTLAKCSYTVPREPRGGVQPVGHAMTHAQALLINDNDGLCGIGEPGEIVIRTPCRSLGYIDGDDGFVTLAVTGEDRVYRTGDRGRYLPDGAIDISGRTDDQLKIRGARVEPAAVAAILAEHDDVDSAVVLGAKNDNGDNILTAYVVTSTAAETDASALRQYVSQSAPHYFVPARFVILNQMPLTASGKVDRTALVKLESTDAPAQVSSTPRTETERQLVEIWSRALKVDNVGIHDDFFELGGHSLLAVRIFTQINERFGVRLPLASMFDAPTIAEMATMLTSKSSAAQSAAVALQPNGDRRPFFCVHGIGGEVMYFRQFAAAIRDDQPFYAFQRTLGDGDRPTVESLAARYIQAMREVQAQGPYLLGGYSMGGSVALEMAHQLRTAGEQVALLAMFDHIPTNAPGKRDRFSPGGMATLLCNVPNWIRDDFLHTPPKRMVVRAKGVASGIIKRMIGNRKSADRQINLARWFGVNSLPDVELQRFQSNYEASRQYQPRHYPGRVTVVISRTAPLLKLRDIVRRWRMLADDIQIINIPGSHGTMFIHPRIVRIVTERLCQALDQACSQDGDGEVRDES